MWTGRFPHVSTLPPCKETLISSHVKDKQYLHWVIWYDFLIKRKSWYSVFHQHLSSVYNIITQQNCTMPNIVRKSIKLSVIGT